jgi:Domain of unknown function (DUF4349)
MSRTRRILAVPVLAVVLGLAACGGASDSGSSAPSRAEPVAAGGAAGDSAEVAAATPAAASGAGGNEGKTAGSGLPAPSVKLVKNADVVIQVPQLNTAAVRVRSIAEGVGGAVASETTSYADRPVSGPSTGSGSDRKTVSVQPGESVLVLRVPVAAMDKAVNQVAGVGKELSRTSSSVDVTADLADLGSRVKTQQTSVERVRALLAKASSLQDIMLLETELSRREADLEALQARQASLAGRAELSTLTVTLRTPDVQDDDSADDDNGFLAGLKGGWHAVVVSTGVVLTVLGALLPIAVVGALIGLPLWWLLRRTAARRRSTSPRATERAGTAPSAYPGMHPFGAAPTRHAPAPQAAAPHEPAPHSPGPSAAADPADRPDRPVD